MYGDSFNLDYFVLFIRVLSIYLLLFQKVKIIVLSNIMCQQGRIGVEEKDTEVNEYQSVSDFYNLLFKSLFIKH